MREIRRFMQDSRLATLIRGSYNSQMSPSKVIGTSTMHQEFCQVPHNFVFYVFLRAGFADHLLKIDAHYMIGSRIQSV